PYPRFETKIKFCGYDRDETLTNFPVLVSLDATISNFDYSDFVSPTNGADLRFYSSKLVELNYEIENWDTNGTSHVWVQVDLFASNSFIYAMWGHADWLTLPAYTTNGAVWDATYRGVWHMTETNALDSTASASHGTSFGNTNAPGIVATAQGFSGSTNYIEMANESQFDITNAITVSAWVEAVGWNSAWQGFVSKNGESQGWQIRRHSSVNSGTFTVRGTTGAADPLGSKNLNNTGWHLVSGVWDGSTRYLFIDGVQDLILINDLGNISLDNTPVRIGCNNVTPQRFHLGRIDEVRISSVARSSNWIWATWLNVVSNQAFNCYGQVDLKELIPFIDITTTPQTVTYDVSTYTIAGTNNENVVGGMWWTNSLTGGSGSIPQSGINFQISNITLGFGNNIITVSGTNISGKSTFDVVSIYRQTLAEALPFIAITNAPANIAYGETSADISGTNLFIAGDLGWFDDNENTNWFTLSGNAWSKTITGLEEGANVITVVGTNQFGHWTNATVTIHRETFDEVKPFIDITNTPAIILYN
ncbi:MAG: LamG domain-containing protein, partial [Planctomycetes bacterium]|nr:LamG domain-containing protein [Planctomycetota bacterium]